MKNLEKNLKLSLAEYNPRRIFYIVVHCSATRAGHPFTVDDLLACHLQRGFRKIGYHLYITTDGVVHQTRPFAEVGAHARGFNLNSIGVCYEGGLDALGHPADTRTKAQRESLRRVIEELKKVFPRAVVAGHYQLTANMRKACPCFDARAEYKTL